MKRVVQQGFTLIEVLIAMVILAISLLAIYKAIEENIQDTAYIQDKTLANWVALNAIANIQLGQYSLSSLNKQISDSATMGHQQWVWTATLQPSKQNQLAVSVTPLHHKQPIITLHTFLQDAPHEKS